MTGDPGERIRDAQQLLELSDFLSVEAYEDDEAVEAYATAGWSPYSLLFTDLASVTFSDLVDESVDVAKRYPGVTDAYREDREVILLSGSFNPELLQEALRGWWVERLHAVL